MLTHLRYGRQGLEVDIPEDIPVQVLTLNPLHPLENEEEAIAASFENPVSGPPLRELAVGRKNACIVISDVTRPVPNRQILTPMLRVLEEAGLGPDKVTLLVATGLHRPNEGTELEEMIGPEIAARYSVVNHFARETADMADLGVLEFAQPWMPFPQASIAVNRHYVQADLKITTGLIEPHFMAGYSGGRKLICPGIAAAETILQFHSPPMIGHPGARAGNLVENPIHAMSLAVAQRAGCDFICNVTLDEERRVTGVFSGAMEATHLAGIAHGDRQNKVPVTPADIVLTTSAGYPLDTTFYQCIKGMVCALPALKPGGTLIIATSLSEGLGGEEFSSMCHTIREIGEFLDRLYSSPVQIDQWQLQEFMNALRHAGEIMIVSDGVGPDTLGKFLLSPYPTVEGALEAARAKAGPEATLVVIPEGPYVTPVAS